MSVSLHREPITLHEEDLFGPSVSLHSSSSSLLGEEEEEDLLQAGGSSEDEGGEGGSEEERERELLSSLGSPLLSPPSSEYFSTTSPSLHSPMQAFSPTQNEEGVTLALVVALELVPQHSAVQDLVTSHVPLLQLRMRALLQVLYHILTELAFPPLTSPHALGEHGEWKAAVEDFQRFFCSLMTFPRLQPPLWQQILLAPSKRKSVLCEFLKELSQGHALFGSDGFLSTILTTVLAYHTSWTRTVQCESSRGMGAPSLTHHFSELFGKTEEVNRSCRVVVVGQNSQMVNSLLFILSFFLRGSCLLRHPESKLSRSSFLSEDSPLSDSVGLEPMRAYTSLWTPEEEEKDSEEDKWKFAGLLQPVESDVLCVEEAPLTSNPYKLLGRSMFAAHCKSYASDFVLMGIRSRSLSTTSILAERISRDLWAQCKFWPQGHGEGGLPGILLQSPGRVAGEEVYTLESASCIVINMDVQSCEVFTFQPHYQPAPLYEGQLTCTLPRFFIRKLPRASLVTDLLDKLTGMWKVDLAPDICLLYFEEALARLYQRSLAVRALLAQGPSSSSFSSSSSATTSEQLFTCSLLAQTLCLPSAADAEMMAVLQDQCGPDHPLAPRYRLRSSSSSHESFPSSHPVF